MATWVAPLPPDDTVAGDPGHPTMHNQLVDALEEVRANVDLNVVTTDPRLTPGAAGVATVRALGNTATTAAAGNDTRLLAGAAAAQADSTAVDVATLVTDFNALLAKLRTRGVLAP